VVVGADCASTVRTGSAVLAQAVANVNNRTMAAAIADRLGERRSKFPPLEVIEQARVRGLAIVRPFGRAA
jgi:hypothetical protein